MPVCYLVTMSLYVHKVLSLFIKEYMSSRWTSNIINWQDNQLNQIDYTTTMKHIKQNMIFSDVIYVWSTFASFNCGEFSPNLLQHNFFHISRFFKNMICKYTRVILDCCYLCSCSFKLNIYNNIFIFADPANKMAITIWRQLILESTIYPIKSKSLIC